MTRSAEREANITTSAHSRGHSRSTPDSLVSAKHSRSTPDSLVPAKHSRSTPDSLVPAKHSRSTSDSLVPARWSSSERPLFVRTVWVGGIRHAILSMDDPVLGLGQYPGASSSSQRKLSAGNRSMAFDYVSSGRSPQNRLDYFFEQSNDSEDEERFEGKEIEKKKKKYRYHGVHTPEDTGSDVDNNVDDFAKAFDDTLPECSFLLGEESRSALSERVLQWLDLANKATASSKIEFNTTGESRTSRRRTKTALSTSYYIDSPTVHKHKRLLTKRLPPSMLLDTMQTADTEFEMDLTPRRLSSSVLPLECKTNEVAPSFFNNKKLFQRAHSSTVYNRYIDVDNASSIDKISSDCNQKIIEPRPVTAWMRSSTGLSSKPQLHIFMPHLSHSKPASFDGSECISSQYDQ